MKSGRKYYASIVRECCRIGGTCSDDDCMNGKAGRMRDCKGEDCLLQTEMKAKKEYRIMNDFE